MEEYSQWNNDNTGKFQSNAGHGPPQRRSLPKRQSVHPYSRYMSDFSMPNARGSYKRTDERIKSPCESLNSKQRFINMHRINRCRPEGGKPQKPISKLPQNGVAEQIRRSRESNTFSLIDAQLGKAPMDRVRELYLQVKGISTTAGNAPRTTKKANLSAVHAIVRFRMREYLLDIRDHSRRLLEQTIALQRNEEPSTRQKEIENLYSNLTSFPCSRECCHCERLQIRTERPRSTPVRRMQRPACGNFIMNGAGQQKPSIYQSSISIKTDESVIVPTPHYQQHKMQAVPFGAVSNTSVLTNESSQFSTSDADDFLSSSADNEIPGAFLNDVNLQNEQKTLWSELRPIMESHELKLEDPFEAINPGRLSKRSRIDSNVSRFCNELGLSAIDWSTETDHPIDLTELLLDCHQDDDVNPDRSQSRFSAAEDDNMYSPDTCDSDISQQNQDSMLFVSADIPVN
ncbi:hypothetical protein Ciccas_010412 [Cichlidogyrus casuarinus]|uniref:Uncharacterized protein n=1 Tax=Cichlidogyrus casuarinus TaxID=1844966 RepID=A0ABD2PUJ2_9PLAT